MNIVISGSLATTKLRQRVAEVLHLVADCLAVTNFRVEINLVDDRVMAKNVLSYEAPKDFVFGDSRENFLGEIYLNPEYIKNHGENFDLMVVHGFLHLMGYVHDKKNDRMKMELIEERILKSCALLLD